MTLFLLGLILGIGIPYAIAEVRYQLEIHRQARLERAQDEAIDLTREDDTW
jgi:hypothetical protein